MRCRKNKIRPKSGKSAEPSSATPGSFSEEATPSQTEMAISSLTQLACVSGPVSDLGEVP
jgi:hypothetical protein